MLIPRAHRGIQASCRASLPSSSREASLRDLCFFLLLNDRCRYSTPVRPRDTMSQRIGSVKGAVEFDRVKQIIHEDAGPFVRQTLSEPNNSTSCWRKFQVFELRSQCRRRPMTKPKRICVPAITYCVTLKPVSFSLVGDAELHR